MNNQRQQGNFTISLLRCPLLDGRNHNVRPSTRSISLDGITRIEKIGIGLNRKQCSLGGGTVLLFLQVQQLLCCNVKYAVGTNNSTVEQLVVVMRERTTTLEIEQQHQMFQLTYQRVTMTSILESLRNL